MSDRQDEKRGLRRVPLLPLRDIVVFPHMVVPLFVGREKSISALEEAMGKGAAGGKEIFLSAQRKAKTNEPIPEDIFTVGTIGTIIQLLRLPDGTVKVLVEGKRRAAVRRFTQTDGFFMVEVEELPDIAERSVELDALVREVHATFETYVKLNKRIAPEILISVQTIEDPGQLADTMVGPAAAEARRQAGGAGDGFAVEAPVAAVRADQGGDRDPAGREEDPDARQEADGEDAEGVLPQRADAGDPEGARAIATSSRTS